MITIIYSTHKSNEFNQNFKKHLEKTVGLSDVQILEYVNFNQYSLAEIYNKGIKESKFKIIVCCHNDIKLENNWGKKLLKDFENNPEYAIIGKAGSCYFPESGVYWEKMHQTMVGQVFHHPEGHNKWLNTYSPKLPYLIPVVTIDGLFISFDKSKVKHFFDETIGRFHFYDHSFCLPNYLEGVKIGVTSSFEITHESIGKPNNEFFESKNKFLEKYKKELPLDLKPEVIYVPVLKEKPLKKQSKVAIIILTKSKLDLLFDCLNSFYNNCDPSLFDIFIADTGSSDEEKMTINNFINGKNNIKFLEYNFYNFAKINNDVVRNHVNDNYEFLLFCNNDIKVLNNVIYGMIKNFKEKPKLGTLGIRLHFANNTIQHDGIFMNLGKETLGTLGHINIYNYYNHSTKLTKTLGSTGGFLMIRKKTFEKCGFFNERYKTCFEDVELNLKCILLGLENYIDGSLVAYHYESQTRTKSNENNLGEMIDYQQVLTPFYNENYHNLKTKLKNFLN